MVMRCFPISCFALGVIAVVAALQPYRPMRFVGESMSPTYRSGEFALTLPVDGPLRRGDVVLVDTPNGTIVKRVALLSGDSYRQMLVAGDWVDLTGLPQQTCAHRRVRTQIVPPGTVYLLGDDLTISVDSRSFGPVSVESVRRRLIDPRPRAKDLSLYAVTMLNEGSRKRLGT